MTFTEIGPQYPPDPQEDHENDCPECGGIAINGQCQNEVKMCGFNQIHEARPFSVPDHLKYADNQFKDDDLPF